MTSRRAFLGTAATAIGTMPFAGTAMAQADTGSEATAGVASDAVSPPSGYGASTASSHIDVISLPRLREPFREAIPEAGYVFVTGAKGDEWTLR